MIKNKRLVTISLILIIVATFFVWSAFAERAPRGNTEDGSVFIKCSVKEISVSDSVAEETTKLVAWERKKREPIEKKLRRLMEEEERLMKRQEIIQNDYIKQRQEQERIKREEEQERRHEQERRQERERIKKEDWFR